MMLFGHIVGLLQSEKTHTAAPVQSTVHRVAPPRQLTPQVTAFLQSMSHSAPPSQVGRQLLVWRQSISHELLLHVVEQLAASRQSNLQSHSLLSHEKVVQVPPVGHSSVQHVKPSQVEQPSLHCAGASAVAPSSTGASAVEPSVPGGASMVPAASEASPSRSHLPSTQVSPLGQPVAPEQRNCPS